MTYRERILPRLRKLDSQLCTLAEQAFEHREEFTDAHQAAQVYTRLEDCVLLLGELLEVLERDEKIAEEEVTHDKD